MKIKTPEKFRAISAIAVAATVGAISMSGLALAEPAGQGTNGINDLAYVQFGAFDEEAGAQRFAQDLIEGGLEDVRVSFQGDVYKVIHGGFEFTLDAYIKKSELLDSGIVDDATVRRFPIDERLNQTITLSPISSVFPSTHLLEEKGFDLSQFEQSVDEAVRDLEAIRISGDMEAYRAALAASRGNFMPQDPAYGYVELNIGTQSLRERDFQPALEGLWNVLKEGTSSLPEHRELAKWRIAWITHQQGNRQDAYRMYHEIENETRSQQTRSNCRVERLGLLVEIAENGIGTHEEVRHAKTKWYDELAKDDIKSRAVMDLIEFQSWSRQPEPDHARAAQLGEEFLQRYTADPENRPLRELASAMHHTAMFHRRAGNHERALELCIAVMEEIPAGVESFHGSNPHARALIGAGNVAAELAQTDLWHDLMAMAAGLYAEEDHVAAEIRKKIDMTEKMLALDQSMSQEQRKRLESWVATTKSYESSRN